jgi:hypothetical protein
MLENYLNFVGIVMKDLMYNLLMMNNYLMVVTTNRIFSRIFQKQIDLQIHDYIAYY